MRSAARNESLRGSRGFVTRIASMIGEELEVLGKDRLPSGPVLASRLGCSLSTVRRAMAVLREHGIVARSRGRRSVPDLSPAAPRETRYEKISTWIREQIADMKYRAGDRLPKMESMARDMHSSNSTLVAVLAQLEKERLVHKRGKFWYAGPSVEPRKAIHVREYPRVLLVLQDLRRSWQALTDGPKTKDFSTYFAAEARRFDVQIMPVFAQTNRAPYGCRLAGLDAVLPFIVQLGKRYIGTFAVGGQSDLGDFADWVTRLRAFRKPVVAFDRPGSGFPERCRMPGVYRCIFSESLACEAAVETLAEFGHRHVVFPYYRDNRNVGWQQERAAHLREACAQKGIAFCAIEEIEPPRETYMTPEMLEREVQDPIAARVLRYSPLFGKVAEIPETTAIIAPRDYSAVSFYYWLASANIDIPARLSLLSFDNSSHVGVLPISSVDFGGADLGYRAFHKILGAIPVRTTRDGDIMATPAVVNRGSIGRPRQGALRFSLPDFTPQRR